MPRNPVAADRLRVVRGIALCCAATAVVLGAAAAQSTIDRAGLVDDLAADGAVARIEGFVKAEPIPIDNGRYLIRLHIQTAEARGQRSFGGAPAMVVGDERWAQLSWHAQVRALVRLDAADPGDDVVAWARPLSAPEFEVSNSTWVRWSTHVRERLRKATSGLPADPAGLVPAMVFGDTSAVPADLTDDMRSTGLTHLSAVSGANVAILLAALAPLLRLLMVPRRVRPVVALLALAAFVTVTRPEPSVIRASAMGVVGLLALYRSTRATGPPALAAAILVLLCYDPSLSRSIGFALSALATLGLLLFVGPWTAALGPRLPRTAARALPALLAPVAAQAACLPILVGLQGGISLIALPANALAAIFVAPVTVLGLILASAAAVIETPASLGWLPGAPALAIAQIARRMARAEWTTIPWPGGATGAACAVILVLTILGFGTRALHAARSRPLLWGLGGIVVLAGAAPTAPFAWPPANWQFVACDVGQGDALVLRSGPRSAVLVDAGPDPPHVDRCLRRLGVRRLDLIVLTHLHADHMDGLTGAWRDREVGAILVGPVADPAHALAELSAAAESRGIPIRKAVMAQRFSFGSADLTVLGPQRRIDAGSVPNNGSLVLHARILDLEVLLLGDIEREAGAALATSARDPGVRAMLEGGDVVKAAHHGSGNLDPPLLALTAAPVTVISVGADNDYGHPAPRLLDLTQEVGSRVLRTDQRGDIAVWRDGPRLLVRTHR